MNIQIYVISLKRDKERRERISSLFEKNDIDFLFFDAIDAKDEQNSELIDSMRGSGVGDVMTKGEIACTISHQMIYRRMIEEQQEWSIILEDDVVIDHRFKEFLQSLESGEYKKLDKDNLYLLGGQKGLHEYPVLGVSLFTTLRIGRRTFRRVNYNIHKIRRTCCYLMNLSMAQQLIDLTKSYGTYRADSWKLMSEYGIIKEFYLNEFILHPVLNESNSHLEAERLLISERKRARGKLEKILKIARSWIKVSFFLFRK